MNIETWYIIGMTFGSMAITIVLVGFIFYWVKYKKFKSGIKKTGDFSEKKINHDLNLWAKKTKNFFLSSSLYKYDDNIIFEVDSILVTDRVFIVVEIKSIKGDIEGDATADNWIKTIDGEKMTIANPIRQNQQRILHLKNMLHLKAPILSLVIFSDYAGHLKIENIPGHVLVTKHNGVLDVLAKVEEALLVKILKSDMKQIKSILEGYQTKKWKDIKSYRKINKKNIGRK